MKKVKILVVDDVKIVGLAFVEELEPAGCKVELAANGEEAIIKAKNNKYDIVFIDYIMPGLNGIETCKEILKLQPDCIPIFMTGKVSDRTIEKEIEFQKVGGKVYYLYKPFSEGELLETTKKALQEYSDKSI